MVTLQVSIRERDWPIVQSAMKQAKEYYDTLYDRMYEEDNRLALKKKKEITSGYIIARALRSYLGEISRLREEEKRKEDSDETSSSTMQKSETKRWGRPSTQWRR